MKIGAFFWGDITLMTEGHFYFLSNEYYRDFPDPFLARDKGSEHGRPCCYAFLDERTGLFWMIPISSKIAKFRAIYDKKMQRGYCDTLVFGNVLGYERAFLIQNMCPVTSRYIEEEYRNNHTPVSIDGVLARELQTKAKRILALVRRGNIRLIFPDVLSIEKALIRQYPNSF